MRQIKFRGKDMTGQWVYGLLAKKKMRSSGKIVWAIATGWQLSDFIPVQENSIAQFVGYDKNDAEIYEGDELIDEYEQEHIAEIYDRPNFLRRRELRRNNNAPD